MNAVLGKVVAMELGLVVKVVYFIMSLAFTSVQKQKRTLRKSTITCQSQMIIVRFVDGLQERINFLESQLGGDARSVGAETRRTSDQDRDHSAAAALSSLARVSTPTAGLHDSTSVHKIYRTPDPAVTPTGGGHENETYEWDEGGDEKDLGADAMGAASTRDYKPGFFGMRIVILSITLCRRLINVVVYGRNQSGYIKFCDRLTNRYDHSTIRPSPSSSIPICPNSCQRCRLSSPSPSKNSRSPRRLILQVRPYFISLVA